MSSDNDTSGAPTARVRDLAKLVHPDFALITWIPEFPVHLIAPVSGIVGWAISSLRGTSPVPSTIDVRVDQILSKDGTASIPTYIARPKTAGASRKGGLPGLLWLHGGGMVLGSYAHDLSRVHTYAQPNPDCFPDGCVVLAPNYRLAPAHPAPQLADDCFAVWQWMISHAAELGIDTTRLVIAGASAGAGLAAVTVHRIHDAGGPQPALQLLIYPMLDDRTVPRVEAAAKAGSYQTKYPLWNPRANRYGWTSYLGGVEPGGDLPQELEAEVPGRRKDLAGLPKTWIGVGDLDLFHEEDVDYATRLREAGVEVTFESVQGGFHGFDAFKSSEVVKQFLASQVEALRGV